MERSTPRDAWAAGHAYEPYVGRWSRLVARDFLEWLAIAPDRVWIDVGCGTGALTETILAKGAPRLVRGIDPSAGFVDYARAHVRDRRASFQVGDAQDLPVEDAAADAVASGLVLNFIPDAARALGEMTRVARPDATIAAYVWDYAGEMQLMRYFWDAAVSFDDAARPLDEGNRFPLCQPERLHALFAAARLDAVETRVIDVPTSFADFDDYWRPFLGGQGPAPTYCMSLPPERREALREAIRATLPTGTDGRIELVARAFAVRGRRSK
jgi:SAM-dependent methyltransferase